MRTVLSIVLVLIASFLRGAAYLLNRVTYLISAFFGVCFLISFFGDIIWGLRVFYLVTAVVFSPFGLPALINFLANKLTLSAKSIKAKGGKNGKAGKAGKDSAIPGLEAAPANYVAVTREALEEGGILILPLKKKDDNEKEE